jgi:hypothetical protein
MKIKQCYYCGSPDEVCEKLLVGKPVCTKCNASIASTFNGQGEPEKGYTVGIKDLFNLISTLQLLVLLLIIFIGALQFLGGPILGFIFPLIAVMIFCNANKKPN